MELSPLSYITFTHRGYQVTLKFIPACVLAFSSGGAVSADSVGYCTQNNLVAI